MATGGVIGFFGASGACGGDLGFGNGGIFTGGVGVGCLGGGVCFLNIGVGPLDSGVGPLDLDVGSSGSGVGSLGGIGGSSGGGIGSSGGGSSDSFDSKGTESCFSFCTGDSSDVSMAFSSASSSAKVEKTVAKYIFLHLRLQAKTIPTKQCQT